MTDIVLAFEVHQPLRIKTNFFWKRKMFQRLTKQEMDDYYFDKMLNQELFERAAKKCYFPANQILLDLIDQNKHEGKQVKIAFSLSGVFLDQCERFNKDVLESFRQLAETGCVEFLDQTYYHSLCGLYPVLDEFVEEVKMHKQAMLDLLHFNPTVFENTELIYHNSIAKAVEKLGYTGIYMEGVERILKNRSPNYVYTAKNCETLRVLLRNYKLTDDIGFRFSERRWREWPLTADKYVSWLATTPGQCIHVFPDYETFGEHHWPETGIHEFLAHLIPEILKKDRLNMATPSDVINKHSPIDRIDVPDLSAVSWADLERDTSCWLGNTMQWAYYTTVRELEHLVQEAQERNFLRVWRYFQISDHLYYMYTSGGAPGEVHTYFNPFKKPVDAFITCQSAVTDFEMRLRLFTVSASEPFKFYADIEEKQFTGVKVQSLRGLIQALSEVKIKSIEFHNDRRDFENWAKFSLGIRHLAEDFRKIWSLKKEGEDLRRALVKVAEKHCTILNQKAQSLGIY